jgi:hypothetical protein
LNPLTAETARLKREYQTFAYKKPTLKMRGLEIEQDPEQVKPIVSSDSSKQIVSDETKTKEE